MKHRLKRSTMLITLFLSCASAFASTGTGNADTWYDFELGDALSLTQALALPGLRGESIALPTGEVFILDEVTELSGISVVNYMFTQKNCAHADWESDMEIILPAENSPNSRAEVGVIYHPDCKLEIFVEGKDLMKPSFFRR